MKTRYFPALKKELSVLALGTQAFGTSITMEESFHILDLYRENGGNFLDTARLYGYYAEGIQGVSEEVLGHWLKVRGCRNEITVATKGAHPPLGRMHAHRLDSENIRSDVEKSLIALQTDHIDLYWLHRDDIGRPVEDIMNTLHTLQKEGKIGAIGASNWTVKRLEEAKQFGSFDASQPQWSLARQEVLEDETLVRFDREAYVWHKETGIPVVPFTSQAKGFYYKLDQGGVDSLSPKARERFLSDRNMRSYEILKEISAETGASVGALSIAYLTNQPFPVYPIVGFSSLKQAESLVEAGNLELTAEQVEALNNSSEIV